MTCPENCNVRKIFVRENGTLPKKDKANLFSGACNLCTVPHVGDPSEIRTDTLALNENTGYTSGITQLLSWLGIK